MANKKTIKNLKIAHWNANGLCNKWLELKDFIFSHEIDIMLINEVKSSEKINFKINGFNSIRKNRPGSSRGGGLLILVDKNIKHSEFCIDHDFQTLLYRDKIRKQHNYTLNIRTPPK